MEQLSESGPDAQPIRGWSNCVIPTARRRPGTLARRARAGRGVSRDRRSRRSGKGSATLELLAAPHESTPHWPPVRVGRGFRFSFAYTVDDLETLRDLA